MVRAARRRASAARLPRLESSAPYGSRDSPTLRRFCALWGIRLLIAAIAERRYSAARLDFEASLKGLDSSNRCLVFLGHPFALRTWPIEKGRHTSSLLPADGSIGPVQRGLHTVILHSAHELLERILPVFHVPMCKPSLQRRIEPQRVVDAIHHLLVESEQRCVAASDAGGKPVGIFVQLFGRHRFVDHPD